MRTRSTLLAAVLPALLCGGAAWAVERNDGHGAGTEKQEYTTAHRKAVDQGKKWLLAAQNRDGSWGMDKQTPTDISATSLAGLALLASGSTARDGYDAQTVRALQKAVDYLLMRVRKAKKGQDIAEGEDSEFQTYVGRNIHTYFTVTFLSQAYGMRSPEFSSTTLMDMREAIQKMTDVIGPSQDDDGSWHKETYSSLQATTLAWTALRSANSTGIPIKHATVEKTIKFVKKQFQPTQGLYIARNDNGGGNPIYDTASCLRILYGSGLSELPEPRRAVDTLLKNFTGPAWGHEFLTSTGEDYPAAVFITHALIKEEGPRWKAWFGFVSKRLFKLQNADGSWTATNCLRGRTVSTACAMLCLQTPLRLLPLQDL